MTIDDFIKHLQGMTHKTEVRRWLRDGDGKSCPITGVCKSLTHAHYSVGDASKAGKKIGLTSKQTTAIMNAADADELTPLRKKLLKAVNLRA